MRPTRDIIDVLAVATRVVIATHEKPDGDALGSSLGLCRILRDAGVNACLLPPGTVPSRFQWMLEDGDVIGDPVAEGAASDVLVVLDCGAVDRIPPCVQDWAAARSMVINIDHHASNTKFGEINWVDTEYCSVGEMIHDLAGDAEWDMPYGAAEALWVAIVTDTGRFAYQNTSSSALRAASNLLMHPIPTAEIDHRVYNSVSAAQLRLQSRALDTLSVGQGGKVATIALSLDDFAAIDCGPEDAEDFVNLPRSIDGVDVAAFLYELVKDGGEPVTKLSLRSSAPYDAAELCRSLGGGGHARAAGCTIPERLDAAMARFLTAVQKAWF